jgi:hypothetical protein
VFFAPARRLFGGSSAVKKELTVEAKTPSTRGRVRREESSITVKKSMNIFHRALMHFDILYAFSAFSAVK